jgi:transcriptional regulator with XRE-family HTH domain
MDKMKSRCFRGPISGTGPGARYDEQWTHRPLFATKPAMSRKQKTPQSRAPAPASQRAARTDARTSETRSFAATLKHLRASRQLSLQDLSDRAQVSRSMISKIEREEVQPSLDVAVRLADALGTRLNAMIRSDSYARIVKIEHERQLVVRDPRNRWERRQLSPSFTANRIEVLRGKLAAHQDTGKSVTHPQRAEEFISVLKGRINVRLDGQLIELEEGDSLFFEGDQGHVLENPGSVEADYMVVIKY